MLASCPPTVTIEGDLVVRLERSDRRVRQVTVRSTRPFAATRVLIGRRPAEAASIVPSLFSICARAQGAAAAGAVEAALGRPAAKASLAARESTVLLETVQEYLWRILVDWPQAMDGAAEIEPVARARRLIAPVLTDLAPLAQRIDGDSSAMAANVPQVTVASLVALAARHIYGGAPADWLAFRTCGEVAGWAERAHTLPARLLGELRARANALGRSDIAPMPPSRLPVLLDAVVPGMRSLPGFERAPTWAGAPVETGALARMQTHPLIAAFVAECGNAVSTRMVARMTELAALLDRLGGTREHGGGEEPWVDAFELADGEGLAAVQTARGLLLHRVRMAGDRVGEYQIVAPTEWNFHPEGALVRGLEGAPASDEAALVRDARLVVQALDPCVACRVEVLDA